LTNYSDYGGWYNVTGLIGGVFEVELLGTKALMGIVVFAILGYMGAKARVDIAIYGAIILGPSIALLARYGYLGALAWVEGLVYIGMALCIGLAVWRIWTGE